MSNWTLRSVEKAIEITSNKKLSAFHKARAAGLFVPDGVVLMRTSAGEHQLSSRGWPSSGVDLDALEALAVSGQGKLVLRALGDDADNSWRAVVISASEFGSALARLAAKRPSASVVYVQSYWPSFGTEDTRIVTTVTRSRDDRTQLAGAYQTSSSGAVAPFDPDDLDWTRVIDACARLERTIGTCTQADFGLHDSAIALLSIRQAPVPATFHIEAARSLARLNPAERGAAVAVVVDVLNATGSQ